MVATAKMPAMAKSSAKAAKGASPMLFVDALKRRHSKLLLPKFLKEEAFKSVHDNDPGFVKARKILADWAALADKGHLSQKETSLDDQFLGKIFGDALGYKGVTDSPDDYERQKTFTVPGAGFADGAL